VKTYFLDSSALAKRYVTETGSSWIRTITDNEIENIIVVARIAWVEVISGLSRLKREGKISENELKETIEIFQSDWEAYYQIVEIDKDVVEKAAQLVQRHPLRAYDSIQLASALKLDPQLGDSEPNTYIFVSGDNRLLTAAEAENLDTENPNKYE
jgi:predicted nucleic acid-binding protein